jgi:hypothetical protein
MTTIANVYDNAGFQQPELHLTRREFGIRTIYLSADFQAWARKHDEVAKTDSNVETALAQMFGRFRQFVTGKPIREPTQLHIVKHPVNCVWELKTFDLRMFGAFPSRDLLLLMDCYWTDDVKKHNLYHGAANQALKKFSNLGFKTENFINSRRLQDVISN